MTTYEISQIHQAIRTFEILKQDATIKRSNAEQQLIEVARRPLSSKDTPYFNALRHTISEETTLIPFYENKITTYKERLPI